MLAAVVLRHLEPDKVELVQATERLQGMHRHLQLAELQVLERLEAG